MVKPSSFYQSTATHCFFTFQSAQFLQTMLEFIQKYTNEEEEKADFQAVLNHASRLGLQCNGYPNYSSSHGGYTIQAVCYSLGDYSGWGFNNIMLKVYTLQQAEALRIQIDAAIIFSNAKRETVIEPDRQYYTIQHLHDFIRIREAEEAETNE